MSNGSNVIHANFDAPKYNEEALARAAAMWSALLQGEVSPDHVVDCLDAWEIADRSCRTTNLRIRPDFDELYENCVGEAIEADKERRAIAIPPLDPNDPNIMTTTEHLNVLYPPTPEDLSGA